MRGIRESVVCVVKEQEMEVEPERWETEEERWRGSVYKRSDAAQSVLVMTQLALHIATNHSPPCPLPPRSFSLLLSFSHSDSPTLKTTDLIGW